MSSYRQWHSLPKCQAGDFYKHPRTLVEAFPCDSSHHVYSQFEPMSKNEQSFVKVIAVILVCMIFALMKGWV